MPGPGSRRTYALVASYAAVAAAWAAFARRVAPSMVLKALRGESYPFLNRMYEGRPPQLPDEYYLTLWREYAGAVLHAWLLHLGYVLLLRRWEARDADRWPSGSAGVHRAAYRLLAAFAFVFLAVAVQTGQLHDYIFDIQIWNEIRKGNDPWFLVYGIYGSYALNAYGPLFNVLAPLVWVNPLANKLLFASAYILTATWLTRELMARARVSPLALLGAFAWFWNPFAWVEVAIRGHFDILVALACLVAVRARVSGRDVLSGASLAVGVLIKYIPIVLLPFLILDRPRPRIRLLASTLIVTGVGMGAAYLAWGPSLFRPLTFAATRFSTLLSIFRFLRGPFSPLQPLGLAQDVDKLAMPILFLGLLRAYMWSRLHRPDPATAATLGVGVLMLLYQNGFPQYQMVYFAVASDWIIATWPMLRRRRMLVAGMVLYFGWLAVFDVIYATIDVGSNSMEELVGLPTFLLGLFLIVCIVRSSPREDFTPEPAPSA